MFLAVVSLLAAIPLRAKEYTVTSPDRKIVVTVAATSSLSWSVTREGEELLGQSRIGLQIAGIGMLGDKAVVKRAVTESFDTTSEAQFPTKFRTLHDRCNQLSLSFRGDWTLRFRVYDNGVAYRFETSRKGDVDVESELAEFNFAGDFETLWPREENPDFISHCEAFFDRKSLSQIEAKKYAYLPVWFTSPSGTRIVVTETDLEDYPCMFLFGGEGQRLHAQFPAVVLESRLVEGSDRNEKFLQKAPYIARTSGSRTYPWRVMTIDPDDASLLENYLSYQLASPAVEGDASWVHPGKISWEWWHSLNLYGVDFKTGVNTQTYKYYIDFAARFGLEYILLDEGWSVSTLNIRQPRAEVDLEELIRYGKERGVGVILWTLWNPMKKDLYGILDTYRDWGVKGIKIDFMQRSDQEMVNFYEEIARAAFDRGLLVDFHGSFKPAGLQRKYPNVMSFEGVYGMENDKCSTDISPAHDCTLPFTRMVAGPMDYTPGATRNAVQGEFAINWSNPMSQGTRTRQAALYVIFESPLQMLCDSPSNYLRTPDFTSFIASIPTVWDETVGLKSLVGEYVAIARRHGEDWYLAAMTDWTPRTMTPELSFLDPDRSYSVQVMADGVNADRVAEDFTVTKIDKIGSKESLDVKLAPGGGYVAIFKPLK